MKRLLLLAAGCAAAATLVPNALAAYQPRLQVDLVRESPAVGGPVTFRVSQPAAHDATAKMVIYTPQGFRPTLGQSPGFQVGTVVAQARTAQLGGALVPLQGRIVADDAAKYLQNPCAPGRHQSVWVLRLEASGQQLAIPVYVDQVTEPAEAELGALRMQVCLGSPDVPPEQGGAALGAKLVSATMTLRGVFTNPVARGQYTFRSIWTPYTPGTATARPEASVEARALVRLPGAVTVNTSLNRRTGAVRVFGTVTEGGRPAGGAKVAVYVGPYLKGIKVRQVVRANARGIYRATVRLQKGTARWFRAWTNVPVRTLPCTGSASPAPAGCVSQTLATWRGYSRQAKKVAYR
jgi:hypothetical protein